MHYAILKTRASRVWRFRVQWNRIEYACREANGSLKPVPVGTTRSQLYCGQCKAKRCLFANVEQDDYGAIDGRKIAAVRARAKGLAGNGKPLTANCWNCQEIRCKLSGYVCRFEPEADPVGQATMIMLRKVADTDCNQFKLRRKMVIPPLNGDGADCGPL